MTDLSQTSLIGLPVAFLDPNPLGQIFTIHGKQGLMSSMDLGWTTISPVTISGMDMSTRLPTSVFPRNEGLMNVGFSSEQLNRSWVTFVGEMADADQYQTVKMYEEKFKKSSAEMYRDWCDGVPFSDASMNEWLLSYLQIKDSFVHAADS